VPSQSYVCDLLASDKGEQAIKQLNMGNICLTGRADVNSTGYWQEWAKEIYLTYAPADMPYHELVTLI